MSTANLLALGLLPLIFFMPFPIFATEDTVPNSAVEMLKGTADSRFKRATEPIIFQFPKDHGVHPEYKTEWWYYTGNLSADDGKQYGYQLTFFRSALAPDTVSTEPLAERSTLAANQMYMAHFAVSDIERKKFQSFERYSRSAAGLAGAMGKPQYQVWLEDWSATEQPDGTVHLKATDNQLNPTLSMDLKLRQTVPPILHGNQGLSQKGPELGNANHYYSLVGLESTGTVKISGQSVEVKGVSWMDHEFGTSALSDGIVGWDWFSIQLENGTILMLARLRYQDGSDWPSFEGTLAEIGQTPVKIQRADFNIKEIASWKSPKSGSIYPSGWIIQLDRFGLILKIQPLLKDQELNGNFTYWEGAVQVKGTFRHQTTSGAGYVELTGY
ncbi:MAG: lipocalin-like domain-containing protein [Candidatus Poribacteria bacterium]|nr:lipocalin-like domain-containing protein [Candidatus Poribacteria bacterium]